MIPERTEQIWLVTLCAISALCAVPFGAVTANWSFGLRLLLALLVLAALALGIVTGISRATKIVLGSLLGMVFLAGLQLLPWPAALVEVVSPGHLRLPTRAAELMDQARAEVSLTVSRDLTWSSMGAWLGAGCALFLGVVVGRLKSRHWLYIAAATGAVFQVVYGVSRWWSQSSEILGREVVGDLSRVRGTFVNPDHFSLYLEITLALIPAVAWWLWQESSDRFGTMRAAMTMLPLAALWMLLLGAVALSGSRAGLAAIAVGFLVQGLALIVWGKDRLSGGVLLGGGSAAVLALLILTGGLGFARLVGTSSYQVTSNLRWAVLRSSLELWREFPVFGSGLGTFVSAYPPFQPVAAEGAVWRHAHNGWVEMLATTGVVGIVLVLLGLVALVWGLRGGLLDGVRTRHRAAALAAMGVLATAALHETVEFGLTMPANATLAALLIGVGLGVPTRVRATDHSIQEAGRSRAEPGVTSDG